MGMNGRQEEEPKHHNSAIFPRSTYSMLYQVDLYNAIMFNCKQSYRDCSALLYLIISAGPSASVQDEDGH